MVEWGRIFRGTDCRIRLSYEARRDDAALCWQVFDRYAAGQGEHRTVSYRLAYDLFGADILCRVETAAAEDPGRYIIGTDRLHLDGRHLTAAGFALAWKYTRERVMLDKQDQCRQILELLDSYSYNEVKEIIERGKEVWNSQRKNLSLRQNWLNSCE